MCPELARMPRQAELLPGWVAKRFWVFLCWVRFLQCGLFACRQCAGRVCCGLLKLQPKTNTHAHIHTHIALSVYEGGIVIYIGDPLKSLESILNLQAMC